MQLHSAHLIISSQRKPGDIGNLIALELSAVTLSSLATPEVG